HVLITAPTSGASGKPELAAGDDLRRPADADALDPLRRSVGPRVERRGAPELDALRDGDLVTEGDAPVAREMHREWACGGTGGGILGDAEIAEERTRLPAGALPCEAVGARGSELPER